MSNFDIGCVGWDLVLWEILGLKNCGEFKI
jgi:hypothetical protein